MKRLAAFVVLGLSVLVLPSSLIAQRGGMSGHGGMSGRGGSGPRVGSGFRSAPGGAGFARPGGAGFAGPGGARFAGPGGARFAPGGFRSGPGRTFGPSRRPGGLSAFGPARNRFASRPFGFGRREFGGDNRRFGFHRFHRFHDRDFFFDDCFGCRSPFFFGGGLFLGSPFFPNFPGDYYGDYYGYGAQPQQQPVVVNTDNGNSVEIASQIQRLTDEVEDLRSEESSKRYYDDRAKAGSGAPLSAKEPAVATVFIFKDGHRISAQSYAIAGQTLWIFNENAARKYQIADLDAAATDQVNAANGVEFHVPEPATKH
ncbi:MAG: hypothetical protein JWN42_575 [Candidatus Angelobacter sp.]|nr:hypothetical protein [Candidatus Angelobacter sp.]